ncbi:MAG: hypothetical protein A3G64_01595 [Candidatus Liptonbacteria bacterium RIFCSPLOWO2_12_FULL_60_15]|uniref:Methyltransferase type 11 domain-containing protein n=1 Tax=Candidatus Liptonbacteria bacterium RIFCSPLOWO2_12_FULL_60_15 TaxID=1798653 RepID=A0A1G2CJE1_9BACT|nr:MAG: hypothetical protein A3G64_01595 [Candidatus Liptonbacteria bacterium RIFCSPLOWO2_12_FULL_60_15]
MEERKEKEIEFHNFLRNLKEGTEEHKRYTSNTKFYAVTRGSIAYVEDWLRKHCRPGKKVLEYGCGTGSFSFFLASLGAHVTGIDISDVGIRQATEASKEKGLSRNTEFLVMDAEATTFPDNSFDVICTAGVLHHLDRAKAFPEMARILKPDGAAIATEPLAHNPFIQAYRKLTPHLRTEFEAEHILHARKDIALARKYFNKVEVRFFHLATLLTVPFRKLPFFSQLLNAMEKVDAVLLKVPYIRRHAWMMVFVLSEPKK